jgi:hypothetical protein
MGLVIPKAEGAIAVLIDATGHGLQAYSTAQAARNTALRSVEEAPDKLLYEIDAALRDSVGAAVSIARIREDAIEFAGVGNVRATVDLSPLPVRPGIVGLRMRTPTVARQSYGPDRWLVMHTDGVSSPRSLPPGDAETVARRLVETLGSHGDDAAVLVARWRRDAQ